MPMSNGNSGHRLPREPAEAADALREDAHFGMGFLRERWRRLLLLFAGLLLPLWGFGALAEELHEGEVFAFDAPLLLFARDLASHGFDRIFVSISALGYEWGVVPVDLVLIAWLGLKRWKREGLFAGLALGGSALLNLATKQWFARERPSLWASIAPETTYSFPSGHAMGSMTLASVAVMLAWHTRWRVPVSLAGMAFVLLVGMSRVYLGVHYPSDILAGWCAAGAWSVACYLLVFRERGPWRDASSFRR